jgi:hypothetical protein
MEGAQMQVGDNTNVRWSQLATNVVASKYFRGHLGTPEREKSSSS